ncbi:hypothetical protein RND81_05G164900 [Saponaria officinalis]|uniref:Uncharacterized protein n=1 Tax=Saponaria officinalis TaxID=3572 RepID=A0AAW1L1L3_SAPOF
MSKLPRNCLTALKLDHLVPVEQHVFEEIPVPNSPVSADNLCQNQDGAPISDAHQVFDKTPKLNSGICVIEEQSRSIYMEKERLTDVHKVFDEMFVPTFILEMAHLAKTLQVEFGGCDHEIGIDEVYYDPLPELFLTLNQGSVVRSSEDSLLNNEDDDTKRGKNGEIQVGDQCSNSKV